MIWLEKDGQTKIFKEGQIVEINTVHFVIKKAEPNGKMVLKVATEKDFNGPPFSS